MSLRKPTRRLPRWLKIVLGINALGLAMCSCSLAFITFWPDVAAQNIDRLRDIIGDVPVAQLEDAILSLQDHIQQLKYQVAPVQPAAPWADSRPSPAMKQPTLTKPTNTPSDTPTIIPTKPTSPPTETFTPLPPSPTDTPANPRTPRPANTPGPSPTPTFTATYITATCSISVSESFVYAANRVSFTANVNRDGPDGVTAYAWFVNGASVGGSGSSLTYTFPTPGSAAVKVTVTLKSGQSLSCETAVDVKVPPTSTSTYTFTPTQPTNMPSNTFTPTLTVPTLRPPTSSPPVWQPSSLTPLGKLPGEGQWSPYLQATDGQTTLAYRTFFQPDPQRPYSIPAIVAFDLRATRLHFVLGTDEPKSVSPQPSRTGAIPAADLQPGVLLATFNGGFKARHGQYGAMADGLTALSAIDGLATVAMYANGQVHIGEWGKDIKDSPDLVAWRQNGKMLIHNGQINPETAQPAGWGATIKGDTITWRSALGLSADGYTLYYVAGLELNAATLAKVMAQTGAAEALELDVNSFWVHFAAIRSNGSSLVAEPLLDAMKLQADRYLKSYSRDFFYVTTVTKR